MAANCDMQDGLGGQYCDLPVEHICVNQCGGAGLVGRALGMMIPGPRTMLKCDSQIIPRAPAYPIPGHGECYLGFCRCHKGWFGHDCAYRMEGVADGPGLDESRPWLQPHVETPASHDPAPNATRLRPLIWVYEMPTDFNSLLLQYRVPRSVDRAGCGSG